MEHVPAGKIQLSCAGDSHHTCFDSTLQMRNTTSTAWLDLLLLLQQQHVPATDDAALLTERLRFICFRLCLGFGCVCVRLTVFTGPALKGGVCASVCCRSSMFSWNGVASGTAAAVAAAALLVCGWLQTIAMLSARALTYHHGL